MWVNQVPSVREVRHEGEKDLARRGERGQQVRQQGSGFRCVDNRSEVGRGAKSRSVNGEEK